ncbi:MAG: hypothetical protein KBT33_06970 [Prevotellaceae bacterium]|nr:hypothetical protein [Candidatus Minthosoma equi]
MKKILLLASAVAMATILFPACNEIKGIASAMDSLANDSAANIEASIEDEDSLQAEEAAEEDAMDIEYATEEDGDVWTLISGTYFFWDSENSQSITVSSFKGENSMTMGEDEYSITIDNSGEIVARNDNGKVVFYGAMYDGGNTLRGVLKGKKVAFYGSGD